MAEKRKIIDIDDNTIPRKRKAISLAQKKQIINLYEGGYGPSLIARDLNFSISTISSILKDKDRIKEHLKGESVSLDSAMITKRRSLAICEMEKQLKTWIEEETKSGRPQTQSNIQNKAYKIYDEIYMKFGDENKIFTASPGWFRRFKVRNKCVVADDPINHKTGKPVDLVEKFWKRLFKDPNYESKRIFKLLETDFHWHKLPTDTSCEINGEKKILFHRNDNEDSTMLLCGNVAGDFKQKPLLIFPAKKTEFEDMDMSFLPVHFRVNENGEMDKKIFRDWFENCFTPEVEKYCKENDFPYKVLLVINRSSWYKDLEELNVKQSNVMIEIVMLPNENIEDQRSFDKFISLYFKAYYLECIFVHAIEESETIENFNFYNFWSNYDILQAINNIDKVWQEINMTYLSAMCTFDVVQVLFTKESEKSERIEEILEEIVKLALELNIKVNRENVMKFIDGIKDKKEKIIVVLNGVNKVVNVTKISDSQNIPPESSNGGSSGFNSKELTTAFYEISSAMRRLQRMENNQERFVKVKQKIQDALMCYRKMLVFKGDP